MRFMMELISGEAPSPNVPWHAWHLRRYKSAPLRVTVGPQAALLGSEKYFAKVMALAALNFGRRFERSTASAKRQKADTSGCMLHSTGTTLALSNSKERDRHCGHVPRLCPSFLLPPMAVQNTLSDTLSLLRK